MILTLYKTSNADNVINKTLTDPVEITINLKRDVDVVNPVIILGAVAGVDYQDYNYCTIDGLNRSYFIRTVQALHSGFASLALETDYLETYKNDILASNADFNVPIGAGDFGNTTLSFTGREEIDFLHSDVELEPSNNSILSVLGVS